MKQALATLILFAVFGCCSPSQLLAQPASVWTGTTGNWSDVTNWSSGVPTGDYSAIVVGSSFWVTQDVPELSLVNLEFAGQGNRLTLSEDVSITRSLTWADGRIDGSGEVNILQFGRILGARLDTVVNNFGETQLIRAPLTASSDNLNGFTWNNFPGSRLVLHSAGAVGDFSNPSGTLNNFPGATIYQRESSATYILCDLVNEGVIEIDAFAQILIFGDLFQSSIGVIHLLTPNSILDLVASSTLDGRLQGEGSVIGNFELHGTIAPGQPNVQNPFGSLSIAGGLHMMPDSILEVDIGVEADQITVMHEATVGGTIRLTTHDGIEPGTYPIVVVTQVLESNGLTLGALPDGIEASLQIAGTELQVIVHSVATVMAPETVSVTKGILAAGDAATLAESDNMDLSITRDPSQIQSVVEFEADGFSPVATPTGLSLKLESSVFARSPVTQTIELFDYSIGDFVAVDTRTAGRFQDQTVNVDATGDLSRFVAPSTSQLRSRVRYQSSVNRQAFTANVDQLIWLIEE